MTKIDVIIPVRMSGSWGRPGEAHELNRLITLLRSLIRHWKGKEPLSVHTIWPGAEIEIVSKSLNQLAGHPQINLHMYPEDLIFQWGETGNPSGHGWRRQQLLKLIAAHVLNPDNFKLILDADCICIADFDEKDLVQERGGWTTIATDFQLGKKRLDWWNGSAKLLGLEENFHRMVPPMGWTPQVIVPEVCKIICRHLQVSFASSWPETMCSKYHTWSEFTLYALMEFIMVDQKELQIIRRDETPLSMFVVEQSSENKPIEVIREHYGL